MKKARALAAFFAVAAFGSMLMGAAYNGYVSTRYKDVQTDNLRALNISFGDARLDADTTLPSSTSATYNMLLPVYNPTGGTISAGTVLIASNTGAGYVNIPAATTDLTTIIGVAAYNITALSKGWMIPRGGGYAVIRTTGTVSVGQNLVSTTSAAGYLTGNATPTTGADVATALTAGTASGGTVLAVMH